MSDPLAALTRARLLLDATSDTPEDDDPSSPTAALARAKDLLGKIDVLPPLTDADEWSQVGRMPELLSPTGPVALTPAQRRSQSVLQSTPQRVANAIDTFREQAPPISDFPGFLGKAAKQAATTLITTPVHIAAAVAKEKAQDFGVPDVSSLKALKTAAPTPPSLEQTVKEALDPTGLGRVLYWNPMQHEKALMEAAQAQGDKLPALLHAFAASTPVLGPVISDIATRLMDPNPDVRASAVGDIAAFPLMEQVYPELGKGLGDLGSAVYGKRPWRPRPENAVPQMLAASGANRVRSPEAAAQALAEMKRVERASGNIVTEHPEAVAQLDQAMGEWRNGQTGVYDQILNTSQQLGHEWDVTDLGQTIRQVADGYARADVPMPDALARLDKQARAWESYEKPGGPTTGRLPQAEGATTTLPRRTMNAVELDAVLQELNAATGRYEDLAPSAKARVQRSNPGMAAQVELAKAVRTKLYEGLGEMGPGITEIVKAGQRRWGQMSEIQKRLKARTAMAERQKTTIPSRTEQLLPTVARLGTEGAIGGMLGGGKGAAALMALDLIRSELGLRNIRRKTISGLLERAMRNQQAEAPPFGWQGPMHGPWPATTGPGGTPGGPGGGSPFGGGPGGGGPGGGAGFPIAGYGMGGLPPNPNTVVLSPEGRPVPAGPMVPDALNRVGGERPVRAGEETEPLPKAVEVPRGKGNLEQWVASQFGTVTKENYAQFQALVETVQNLADRGLLEQALQHLHNRNLPLTVLSPVRDVKVEMPPAGPAAEAGAEVVPAEVPIETTPPPPPRPKVAPEVARAAYARMAELFPKELPELVKAWRESTGIKAKSKASKWAAQADIEGGLVDWLTTDAATSHSDLKDYQTLLERARTVIRKATPKPPPPEEPPPTPPAAPEAPPEPSGAPPASAAPATPAPAPPKGRAAREAASAAKAVEPVPLEKMKVPQPSAAEREVLGQRQVDMQLADMTDPMKATVWKLSLRGPEAEAIFKELVGKSTDELKGRLSINQVEGNLRRGKAGKYHAKAREIGQRLIDEAKGRLGGEDQTSATGVGEAGTAAVKGAAAPPPGTESFLQAQRNRWGQLGAIEEQLRDASGAQRKALLEERDRLEGDYEAAWEQAAQKGVGDIEAGDSDQVQELRDEMEAEPNVQPEPTRAEVEATKAAAERRVKPARERSGEPPAKPPVRHVGWGEALHHVAERLRAGDKKLYSRFTRERTDVPPIAEFADQLDEAAKTGDEINGSQLAHALGSEMLGRTPAPEPPVAPPKSKAAKARQAKPTKEIPVEDEDSPIPEYKTYTGPKLKRRVLEVDPKRFSYGKGPKDVGEGDIRRAYSADTLPKIRPPVEIEGDLYTHTGGMSHGDYEEATLWKLTPEAEWTGPKYTQAELHKAWDAGKIERANDTGLVVTWKGKNYVLSDPVTAVTKGLKPGERLKAPKSKAAAARAEKKSPEVDVEPDEEGPVRPKDWLVLTPAEARGTGRVIREGGGVKTVYRRTQNPAKGYKRGYEVITYKDGKPVAYNFGPEGSQIQRERMMIDQHNQVLKGKVDRDAAALPDYLAPPSKGAVDPDTDAALRRQIDDLVKLQSKNRGKADQRGWAAATHIVTQLLKDVRDRGVTVEDATVNALDDLKHRGDLSPGDKTAVTSAIDRAVQRLTEGRDAEAVRQRKLASKAANAEVHARRSAEVAAREAKKQESSGAAKSLDAYIAEHGGAEGAAKATARTMAEPPVPKSKAAAARAAKAGPREPVKVEGDDVFVKPDPAETAKRLTPDIRKELERIVEEFEIAPFQKRIFTPVGREVTFEGARDAQAGGKYYITEGHAGAKVYDDIREHSPVLMRKGKMTETPTADRGVVLAAVKQLLETGKVTKPIQEGALRVAERRAFAAANTPEGHAPHSHYSYRQQGISRPLIEAWWQRKEPAGPPDEAPFDVPEVELSPEERAQAARDVEEEPEPPGRAGRERRAAKAAAKKGKKP